MTRPLVLALLLSASALAQESRPAKPPQPAPTQVNQRRVKAQLSDAVGDLLRGIRDGKTEQAAKVLQAWKPTQADLDAVLNDAGRAALGAKLLAAAEETFAGTPAQVGERLGLDTTKLVIRVHPETTEGLEAMTQGSNAAMHYAAAMRRTSRFFNKRLNVYSVSMAPRTPAAETPSDAPPESAAAEAAHLLVFARVGERFVYLGHVWKQDPDYKAPPKPAAGEQPSRPKPGGALGEDGKQ